MPQLNPNPKCPLCVSETVVGPPPFLNFAFLFRPYEVPSQPSTSQFRVEQLLQQSRQQRQQALQSPVLRSPVGTMQVELSSLQVPPKKQFTLSRGIMIPGLGVC